MNNIYYPIFSPISDNKYIDIRKHLLSQSFFIHQLIFYLRSKIGIPDDILDNEEKITEWEAKQGTITVFEKKTWGVKSGKRIVKERFARENKARRKVYKPIYDMVDKFFYLGLDFEFLKWLVFGYTKFTFFGISPYPENIYVITSSEDPLYETGVYVKYSPELSDREFLILKRQAKTEHERIYKHFIKEPFKKQFGRKSEKISVYELSLYSSIEQSYVNYYKQKPNEYKIKTVFEVLAKELKSNTNTIRNAYYRVQNRYNLPSITEASIIPTL